MAGHDFAKAARGNPAISVVLATTGETALIRKTLAHLRSQTACAQLELVIVSPRDQRPLVRDAELAGFCCHQWVRVDAIRSKACANAAGLRRARAEIVAFAEDHCFPDSGWAAALLARHDGRWAAVGPRVRSANPNTGVSWCDLLLNYGPWLDATNGPVDHLPGHNCSYKKAALVPYQGELEAWLDVETELHLDMVRRGAELYFEAGAQVAHVNISCLGPWLQALFLAGRVYAAQRRRAWSRPRRFLYAGAWAAIPFVRALSLFTNWPRSVPDLPSPARLGSLLLLGLVADAAGQGLGYLIGAGAAPTRLLRFEFNRAPFVQADERHALAVEAD